MIVIKLIHMPLILLILGVIAFKIADWMGADYAIIMAIISVNLFYLNCLVYGIYFLIYLFSNIHFQWT